MATATVLIVSQIAAASVPLTEVSVDPYTNPTSQHATEVEPDTFATAAQAVNGASSLGAGPITGVGTGETHRALKND